MKFSVKNYCAKCAKITIHIPLNNGKTRCAVCNKPLVSSSDWVDYFTKQYRLEETKLLTEK